MKYSYSIAIRTLGTSGEKFVHLLDSIVTQTIKPEKVVIYIAKGYKRPTYSIGIEEYVEVKKGMVTQRALNYDEINSDYILMLDDDVELAPNSAELLLNAAIINNVDCVAADTFKNHEMSHVNKLYNIFVNLVFPFRSNKWGRKVHSNGSIAYNSKPKKSFYLAQCGEGPASLWKKDVVNQLNLFDETWLDSFRFSYAEDQLIFYKLYINNFTLGYLYNTGINHLDGQSSSGQYKSDPEKYLTRSKALFVIWYRSLFDISSISIIKKTYNLLSYIIKIFWCFFAHLIAMIRFLDVRIPYFYLKGIYDGIKFINSNEYKNIPNYIIKKQNNQIYSK